MGASEAASWTSGPFPRSLSLSRDPQSPSPAALWRWAPSCVPGSWHASGQLQAWGLDLLSSPSQGALCAPLEAGTSASGLCPCPVFQLSGQCRRRALASKPGGSSLDGHPGPGPAHTLPAQNSFPSHLPCPRPWDSGSPSASSREAVCSQPGAPPFAPCLAPWVPFSCLPASPG